MDYLSRHAKRIVSWIAIDPDAKKTEAPAEVAAIDDGEKAMDPASEKKAESLIDKLTGKKADGATTGT